jgi:mono/diheme cytochrome c family protein
MKLTLGLSMLVLLSLPVSVLADDDDDARGKGKSFVPAQLSTVWKQECGSCHVGYVPGLLPAASWRKVMSGLDRHFGADASLTPQENAAITDYLVRNASAQWSGPATPLRITETEGFKRKHAGDEIPAGVFKRPSVKSAANCQVCHAGAELGDFNEDRVTIPR